MNVVLFQAHELEAPLPRTDPRARHILEVLRCGVGDEVDAGRIDGPRGKARVEAVTDAALTLSFAWGPDEPPLDPITLIVGLSRPQTNRKVLREAAALGVRRMWFPRTDRGEATYADSRLWTSREWERHVLDGVGQAFATRVPEVAFGMSLAEALDADHGSTLLALDNYEAEAPLHAVALAPGAAVVLALGAERGWTGAERDALRGQGYRLVGLGARPLRTETAVVAALALVKARTGAWDLRLHDPPRQET